MDMTLSFNLPDEQDEATLAFHGNDLWGVLWDMSQELRQIVKYDTEYDTETAEYLQNVLYDLLDKHNVSLDMVA